MRFLKSIQQDAKLFLYLYALILLFRIAFLVIYAGQLGSAGVGDILTALWLGARISLKTTAFLVAFPFLFATIPYALWSKWPEAAIRKALGSVEISLMTFLFMARIPYYEIFHQGFNIMLFNGMKDDKWAIFDTAVQQYALWPRLFAACVLVAFFVWLWLKVLGGRMFGAQRGMFGFGYSERWSAFQFLQSFVASAGRFTRMTGCRGRVRLARGMWS